jgi:hypothetical protein
MSTRVMKMGGGHQPQVASARIQINLSTSVPHKQTSRVGLGLDFWGSGRAQVVAFGLQELMCSEPASGQNFLLLVNRPNQKTG